MPNLTCMPTDRHENIQFYILNYYNVLTVIGILLIIKYIHIYLSEVRVILLQLDRNKQNYLKTKNNIKKNVPLIRDILTSCEEYFLCFVSFGFLLWHQSSFLKIGVFLLRSKSLMKNQTPGAIFLQEWRKYVFFFSLFFVSIM